jgi:hypothetical protein
MLSATSTHRLARIRKSAWSIAGCLVLQACITPYESRHEALGDSREQIWRSEESQVKLRAAQSRVFDTTDRTRILTAVVDRMQDLGFMIEVLDEELGIVSGARFDPIESGAWPQDPTYHLYDDRSLLIFARTYRTWGPFIHRNDLVRMTVTVRRRNEGQTVVRANVQHYLRALENPAPYQDFFRSLERALLLTGGETTESG